MEKLGDDEFQINIAYVIYYIRINDKTICFFSWVNRINNWITKLDSPCENNV